MAQLDKQQMTLNRMAQRGWQCTDITPQGLAVMARQDRTGVRYTYVDKSGKVFQTGE
jgi:hypothetical protein